MSVLHRAGRLLPRRQDYAGLGKSWRGDVIAGATVGVVALPLALAFGITSGLGATAGIVTAIVAGVVAAVFGGSNVQVSGPTGAMTVVLVPIVAQYGTSAVYVVSMLAGALIIVAAVARAGRFLAFIPWPVVEGFTIGIAIIIFLQQVPSALGVAKPVGENAAAVAARAVARSFGGHVNFEATALVGLAVAVMAIAPRIHRTLPGSLFAVVVTTLVAQAFGSDVATIGALPRSIPMPSLPDVSAGEMQHLVGAAVAVALLASIESLLSAKVADGMSDASRHDPDRELFGQGLANIASPLFGGMPSTGAIARTAVNVRAGARTRVSAVVHSLVLVLVVLVLGPLVARIPLAALAGVLMFTAVRMVEVHNVRAVVRSTRADAAVLALTATATIAFDLIVAVELGIAIAAILALRAVAQSASVTIEPFSAGELIDDEREAALLREHIVVYRLDGALFFGAAQRFLTELTAVTDVRVMILRLPELQVLDATGAQALGEIVSELEARHITVLLKGLRADHLRILRVVGALEELAHERHVFSDLGAALAHARTHAGAVPHLAAPAV